MVDRHLLESIQRHRWRQSLVRVLYDGDAPQSLTANNPAVPLSRPPVRTTPMTSAP